MKRTTLVLAALLCALLSVTQAQSSGDAALGRFYWGTVAPEGVKVGRFGDLYHDTNAGVLYQQRTVAGGLTGWTIVIANTTGSPTGTSFSALSSGIMRVATGTGAVTSLTTSAGIAANLSDETGSGALVFGTSPTIASPTVTGFTGYTNTGTITNPTATGGIPVVLYCGSTGTGNQTCSPAAAAATTKVYAGHSTLSSSAAVITFPTAFASTTYDCVANDITTRANPVQMISTSASTATITNTTGASDVINWVCVGQ